MGPNKIEFRVITEQKMSNELCLSHPKALWVFGENQQQKGTKIQGGGQATIRPRDNAVGICTLKGIYSYWTDNQFDKNKDQIESDIREVLTEMNSGKYDTLVFPEYGLGTGRAFLSTMAPLTFFYLCKRLYEEFGFNNVEHLTTPNF